MLSYRWSKAARESSTQTLQSHDARGAADKAVGAESAQQEAARLWICALKSVKNIGRTVLVAEVGIPVAVSIASDQVTASIGIPVHAPDVVVPGIVPVAARAHANKATGGGSTPSTSCHSAQRAERVGCRAPAATTARATARAQRGGRLLGRAR